MASLKPADIKPIEIDSITPSIIPPIKAPKGFPKPPNIAAAKPFSPNIPPISKVDKVIGVIMTPPNAPTPALKAKVNKTKVLRFIPTS